MKDNARRLKEHPHQRIVAMACHFLDCLNHNIPPRLPRRVLFHVQSTLTIYSCSKSCCASLDETEPPLPLRIGIANHKAFFDNHALCDQVGLITDNRVYMMDDGTAPSKSPASPQSQRGESSKTRGEVCSVPVIQAPPKSMKNRRKATQEHNKGDVPGSSQQPPSLLSPTFPSPLTISHWNEHASSPQGCSSFSEGGDSEVSLETSFEARNKRRSERMDERDISSELERNLEGLQTNLNHIHKHFTKKEVPRKAPREMQLPLINVAEAVHKGLVAYLCSGERDVSQFPSDPDWIKSKYHDDIFRPMVELITALTTEVKGLSDSIGHSSSSSSEEGSRKKKLERGSRYRGHANSDSSSSEGAAPLNSPSFPQRQPSSPLPWGRPDLLVGEEEAEDPAKMRAEVGERWPGQETTAQRKTRAETDKQHGGRTGSSHDVKTTRLTGGNSRIRPENKASAAPKTSIAGSSRATDRRLPSASQQIESTQKSAQDPEWTGLEQRSGSEEVDKKSDNIQEVSLEPSFRPEPTPPFFPRESSQDEEVEGNPSPSGSAETNWFRSSNGSWHSDEAQTPRAGKRLADELEDAEASAQQQRAEKSQRSFWRQLLELVLYLQLLLFFVWETVREATSKRKSPARIFLPLAYSLWLLQLIVRIIARRAVLKGNLPTFSLSRLTTGLMSLARLVPLLVFCLLRPALLLLTMQIYVACVRERSIWLQASGLTRQYLIGYAHADPAWWFMPGVDPRLMPGVSGLGALAVLLLQTVDVWLGGGMCCIRSGGRRRKMLSSTLHGT